ncbi:MAG: hypothetical protein ABEI27_03335 [Halobellus sp.]|uniref:hypothetical protein n=1 Tax=Halobellus sp. TaxID=1979212 RepID=UPI0035D52590
MAASALVFGAAGALFPRRVIDVAGRLLLAGYENPEELEPAAWYVSAARGQSALSALAGVIVLALEYGPPLGDDEVDSDAEE